jgi:8-amino-7-oxononanoate synthase
VAGSGAPNNEVRRKPHLAQDAERRSPPPVGIPPPLRDNHPSPPPEQPLTSRSLDDFATAKLAVLERRHLHRDLRETDHLTAVAVRDAGRELVSFAGNDYLGLAHHPDVIAASIGATQRYGTGAGASRLVSGNHPLYAALEQRLAGLKGSEDAVVFGSGYLASVGVLSTLAAAPDLVLIDELAHSCLHAGAALSGAQVVRFMHNDTADLAARLTAERAAHRHCLIVTEGVFSMDGDRAPLPELAALAREHDAWLVTDDAHAVGVIGNGRGSAHAHDEPVAVDVQIGTLSKAVGAYGGYVCTSRPVADWLRNRARTFVYSTGLPPGTVGAAIRALEIIAGEPDRVARPLAHARRFTNALALPDAASAIVPIVLGAPEHVLEASRRLRDAGFLVVAIRPPTVPAGTARLRLTFSAAHTEAQIDALVEAVAALPERNR